jgi:hypothetical protein
MGWGSESQEEGEPAPGRKVGSGLTESREAWVVCAFPGLGTPCQESCDHCPFTVWLWEECSSVVATQPTVDSNFVSILPPHTHIHTRSHTGTHPHASFIVASVIMTLLEQWLQGKRFALGMNAHCPILSLLPSPL